MQRKVKLGIVALASAALFGTLGAPVARAQCVAQWESVNPVAGLNGSVDASTVWDPDGPGPQPSLLVVGGNFGVAGNTFANSIAT